MGQIGKAGWALTLKFFAFLRASAREQVLNFVLSLNLVMGVGMNSVAEHVELRDVISLQAASLLNYEFVVSDDDFFVSVNGGCEPSKCDSYRIDGNGCFVLQGGIDEFVSVPIPAKFRELLADAQEIMFVHFENGEETDANVLPRMSEMTH